MSAPGQPFKACPKCNSSNALDAPVCNLCGHTFSTQFIDPNQSNPGQTQAFSPQQQPYGQPQQPSGEYQQPQQPYGQQPYGQPQQPYGNPHSAPQQHFQNHYGKEQQSMVLAIVLAFFLGTIGVHRLYLGHTSTGIIMLVLGLVGYATWCFYIGMVILLGVGIWAIVDIILIATGSLRSADGTPLKN